MMPGLDVIAVWLREGGWKLMNSVLLAASSGFTLWLEVIRMLDWLFDRFAWNYL